MSELSQHRLIRDDALTRATTDALREAASSAKASEKRMRQVMADVVHDLRTPLTVLCGASELLLGHDSVDDTEAGSALLTIHREATRMARLVDNLSRLSRLDGGQTLNPRVFTLSAFLEDFVTRYAPAWPDRSLEVDASRVNGTRVQVDPEALTRALTNLVDNAARYSSPGGPIRIRGEAAERTVSVVVEDDGPGLSSEDARRAFERMYQGSTSRSRQSTGSGLGLAIVHALVRQSQGEVHMDTAPDRGTTVAITLPRLSRLDP